MSRLILLAVCLLLVAMVSNIEANCGPCRPENCNPEVTREKCLARGAPGKYHFSENAYPPCGCCPLCLEVLKENEDCKGIWPTGSSIPKQMCPIGMLCDFPTKLCKTPN